LNKRSTCDSQKPPSTNEGIFCVGRCVQTQAKKKPWSALHLGFDRCKILIYFSLSLWEASVRWGERKYALLVEM